MEGGGRGATVHSLRVRPFRAADEPAVVTLWERCALVVPGNDPRRDIRLKVQFQPDLLLVGTHGGDLAATVMAGYEGHRGWINYLAVEPALQRRGYGRQMMAAAEAALRQLGCPKINLQVRGTNTAVLEFYRRLGFSVEDRVGLGKRLT